MLFYKVDDRKRRTHNYYMEILAIKINLLLAYLTSQEISSQPSVEIGIAAHQPPTVI
jgi:hypothetical protein